MDDWYTLRDRICNDDTRKGLDITNIKEKMHDDLFR